MEEREPERRAEDPEATRPEAGPPLGSEFPTAFRQPRELPGDSSEWASLIGPVWPETRAVPEWAQDTPGRGGPARIGPYLLGPVLGEGGMGTVYLAWDTGLGRRVALKLVRGESQDLLRRMIQEAQLQARVEHPAVCRIYQIGEGVERPFIAMQYIQGANLSEWAPHLGLAGKLRLMLQVADAINAAHRTGLIHRDLKPSNILVEQDEAGVLRPFVMDFGLARDLDGTGITQHGIAVGSPSYMAPEQAAGAKVDERTDVYGLGATLYELISGRPPFRGGTVVDTVRMVMESDAPMLRALDPALPQDLESVVHKCLDKDPYRRYKSARALRDDLQRCLDGEPVEARRQNRIRRALRRLQRNRTLSLVVASAIMLVFVAAGLATWTWREAREQAFWAQRFGQQVREMDATLRNAHLFPLHDLRPERMEVQARLDRIQEQMKQLSGASQGPGWFALGQGYLMLDRPGEARKSLQAAWEGGYRTPEVATALAEALADLHRSEVEDAFSISRETLRQATLEQVERTYKEPIRTYLGYARQGGGLTPLQAAVIARLEHRPNEAARLAREAFDRQRWNYEARIEEIEALYQAAREASDREEEHLAAPRLDEAERLLGWLKEAARSDPRVYLCDAQARLLRIRLAVPGRPIDQSLREGLLALDRALKADPASGEPHLLRASMFRWMAVSQSALPVQANYWMDRAIEAAVHAVADPFTRARALAVQGSLLLAKAQRLEDTGRDPTGTVTEGCALWQKALAEGVEPPSQRLQGALETAYGQFLLADHAQAHGKDPAPSLNAAQEALRRLLVADSGSVDALLELARVQRRIGESQARRGVDPDPWYKEARLHLDRHLQALPSSGSGWNSLGTLAQRQAEAALRRGVDPGPLLETAATAFGNAWKTRPRAALYPFNLQEIRCLQAEQALRRGEDPSARIQEAEGTLALAAKQEGAPDLAGEFGLAGAFLHRLKAERERALGRSPEPMLGAAERDAREAVRLMPRSPRAWMALALVLNDQAGQGSSRALVEGRRAFTRLAQLDPADPEVPLGAGRLELLDAAFRVRARQLATVQLGLADGYATQALAMDARRADAQALRACLALARSRWVERTPAGRDRQRRLALESARTALGLNPGQPAALGVVAYLEPEPESTAAPARRHDPALDLLLGRGR